MPEKTITISDVAEQAGVSRSTVSRVLAGSPAPAQISQETRVRVERIARELGYRPHPGARALSGKRSGLLGVILREVSDPFFADLVEAISAVAKERGYDVVLGSARRDPEQALALRETMLDLRYCDGILLCGDLAESPEDRRFVEKLEADRRLVSVSRGNGPLLGQAAAITIDNRRGALLALEHLAGLGHSQIACFDVSRVGDLWERLETYREFMHARLGGAPAEYVQPAENSHAGGYNAARELFALANPPTALFALDDAMAIGAMAAASDLGLSVPRYVSVVGFDDHPISAYVRPALTTVRVPIPEMGRQAVELLLRLIEDQQRTDTNLRLGVEPELMVRDSTAPPRG